MHVAQDQSSQGEGAENQGHSREILTKGEFKPDDKSDRVGYIRAQDNTKSLLRRTREILWDLQHQFISYKSYSGPEVRIIRKRPVTSVDY